MNNGQWQTKIAAAVCLGGLVLAALSLVFAWRGPEAFAIFFAVTSEQNLPTWHATGVLLTVALTAATVAHLARAEHPELTPRWRILALVFALLSLDELVSLHERLEVVGAQVREPGGLFHFVWVIPGFILGVGVIVAVAQLARALPRPAARNLHLGIAVFLGGAIGLEMVGGLVLSTIGTGWTYQIVSTIEETAEVFGAAIVLHACLRMIDLGQTAAIHRVRYALSY